MDVGTMFAGGVSQMRWANLLRVSVCTAILAGYNVRALIEIAAAPQHWHGLFVRRMLVAVARDWTNLPLRVLHQ